MMFGAGDGPRRRRGHSWAAVVPVGLPHGRVVVTARTAHDSPGAHRPSCRAGQDRLEPSPARTMPHVDPAALNLASAFLAGAWTADALKRRAVEALGGRPHGLTDLVRRVLAAHPEPPHPDDHESLAALVAGADC